MLKGFILYVLVAYQPTPGKTTLGLPAYSHNNVMLFGSKAACERYRLKLETSKNPSRKQETTNVILICEEIHP